MFITPSFTTLIPHESTNHHIASSHAPCEHKRSIPANLSVFSLSRPSIILHHYSPKPLQSNVLSQFNTVLISLHQIPSIFMPIQQQRVNTQNLFHLRVSSSSILLWPPEWICLQQFQTSLPLAITVTLRYIEPTFQQIRGELSRFYVFHTVVGLALAILLNALQCPCNSIV